MPVILGIHVAVYLLTNGMQCQLFSSIHLLEGILSNWNEHIDYLPLYGALAVLLVWEPNNSQQKLMWIEGLRKNMPNDWEIG